MENPDIRGSSSWQQPVLDRLRYRPRALFRRGALERDARGTQWLETLLGDIRFALRHFARRRLVTATIVAVLSLGIAVHAFELTLLRIATVKPPPGISSSVPLARVRGLSRAANQPEWSGRWMPYPEVRQLAALDGVFSSLAVSSFSRVVVAPRFARGDNMGDETVVTVQFVNDDYFRTLGVDVLRGPGLPRARSDGTGGELIAVVSDATWDRMLGRPATVGQEILVNGRIVRVAGVAPPNFVSSIDSEDDPGLTMWMPLGSRPLILAASGASTFALASADSGLFEVVGRLRDGVNADSATKMVRRASAGVRAAITQPTSPDRPRILYDVDAVYLRGVSDLNSDLPLVTGIWAIVSTLILLVVCTNVSGLIAASAATRGHEIAVRLSLGASRRRIVRQLLTESCILSLAGSAAGVFIYWAAFRLARARPEAQYYAPDLGTLMLTLVSAFGVGILFGLTPALHAARGDVRGALGASGPGVTGPSRLQRTLVTAQIALTQPLLVAIASVAVVFLMGPVKQLAENVQEQVVKFRIDQSSLAGGPEERVAALQRLVTHIRETPGVVSVLPDAAKFWEMKFAVPEQERVAGPEAGKEVMVGYYRARPGFFKLLDVPLLGGDDRVIADSMRTVVIGTDLARRLLGDANPVGRYLEAAPPGEDRQRYLVTGVYDSRLIGEADMPVVYHMARDWWSGQYLVRTSRPAADLMIPIRRVIRAELPTTPIETWTTLAASNAGHNGLREAVMVITGVVTVVLLISCIGLYGVVSLAVVQRQREIGIRMALGARAREVVSLFYRSGMRLTALGLVFGLPISLAGGYIIQSMENIDLLGGSTMIFVGAAVGGVMLIVASLAMVFPATRAATVDPVSVLRSE